MASGVRVAHPLGARGSAGRVLGEGQPSPVARCRSRRAQLLLLKEHVNVDVAPRAEYAWNSLSRAGHHQATNSALSAKKLNSLRAEAQMLVGAVGPA